MTSYLKAGVHAALLGPDLVLLDVADDSYLCLPGGARACKRTDGATRVEAGAVQIVLAAAGLLAEAPVATADPPPDRPGRSIIHEASLDPTALDWIRAIGVLRDLGQARRGAGLQAFLARPRERRALSRDHDAVVAASKRFWRLMPWLPAEGECLVRSAMLVSFLTRSGLAADWVFGVRLWPFMAHCWVQSGDVCLNDDRERLVAFTPILRR